MIPEWSGSAYMTVMDSKSESATVVAVAMARATRRDRSGGGARRREVWR